MAGKNISTNFKVITDSVNNYFKNNRFTIGEGVPESGDFLVGDIVISNTQADGIFGWVCIDAGNPGNWEVIGSGMNEGGTTSSSVIGYVNVVTFSEPMSEMEIGITKFVSNTDFLEVHYNGLLLAKDVHYTLSDDDKSILAIGEPWNADGIENEQMIFRVIKTDNLGIEERQNMVTITEPTTSVDMGIEDYDEAKDILEVHYNGVLLTKGMDYNYDAEANAIVKADQEVPWNAADLEDQFMVIKVFKSVGGGAIGEPEEGSVTLDKLSPELQEMINFGRASVGRTQNVVLLEEDMNNIEIGIATFLSSVDMLLVFKNSVFLTEGVDYQVNNQSIENMTDSDWVAGDEFTFIVLQNIPVVEDNEFINGGNLANSSVTLDKLGEDVQQAINNASNIDLSGYATKEELEEKADDNHSHSLEELGAADADHIGNLSNLQTVSKGNLVSAINELNSIKVETFSYWIGTQAQYDALEEIERNKLYMIIPDETESEDGVTTIIEDFNSLDAVIVNEGVYDASTGRVSY